jgi:diacylglycerol kinase family enzyme
LSNEGQTATPLPNRGLWGAVVASYGLHATLVADSDTTEYRKHGDKRFGLVAQDLMFPGGGAAPHAYKADVTLFKSGGKKEVLERKEHGYLLTTPLSNLERKFTISPLSKPLDGQLRIVHFGTVSGDQAMKIMMEAYNAGNHVNLDDVSYESIEGMRIDLKEKGGEWKWRRFCIDGLIVGVEENGWMEVQKLEEGNEAADVLADL